MADIRIRQTRRVDRCTDTAHRDRSVWLVLLRPLDFLARRRVINRRDDRVEAEHHFVPRLLAPVDSASGLGFAGLSAELSK